MENTKKTEVRKNNEVIGFVFKQGSIWIAETVRRSALNTNRTRHDRKQDAIDMMQAFAV